jgi:hypothetical protein
MGLPSFRRLSRRFGITVGLGLAFQSLSYPQGHVAIPSTV